MFTSVVADPIISGKNKSRHSSKCKRETPLGMWITQMRGERSQRRLAEAAGISPQIIHMIEIGSVTNPRATTIKSICKCLNTTYEEFLSRCQ